MKRTMISLLALAAALGAFADDDDYVLGQARDRAAKKRRPSVERDETENRDAVWDGEDDDEGISERRSGADDDDDIFLPLAFSVLPGSPLPGRDVDASFGLGLIISSLDDVYGAQASSIGSTAAAVRGVQGSGIFNVVEDRVDGAQFAGVFNVAGPVGGMQYAGVFNVASGPVGGAQFGGVFNVAEGRVDGVQGAGVFNVSEGGGPLQAAGVFNIAEGRSYGLQAAGVFNIAEDFDGLQAAGVFNAAEQVKGAQIGLVNVADTVDGVQVGLVNIVRDGIDDFGVWIEDSQAVYVFSQRGGEHFYTLTYAGAPRQDWFNSARNLTAAMGFGYRFGHKRGFAIDLDLSAKARYDVEAIREAIEKKSDYYQNRVFPSARASVRLPLGALALHAGAVADIELPVAEDWKLDPLFRESDSWSCRPFSWDLVVHPKLFVGLSF